MDEKKLDLTCPICETDLSENKRIDGQEASSAVPQKGDILFCHCGVFSTICEHGDHLRLALPSEVLEGVNREDLVALALYRRNQQN